MNCIDGWKEQFDRIRDKVFSIKRNVRKFNLLDMQLKISTALANTLESETTWIELEDEERCLFSISKSKAYDVKLPTFDGNQLEDFLKFKKETLKGFKS